MKPISSTELLSIAADASYLMTDTCQVQTYSGSVTDMGDVIPVYTSGSTIACLFIPGDGKELMLPDKTVGVADGYVTLPLGTVVSAADRIVTGNVAYEVIGFYTLRTGVQVAVRKVLI